MREVMGYESESDVMGFAPVGPRGRLRAGCDTFGSGTRDVGRCRWRAYSRVANSLNTRQQDSNTDGHNLHHIRERAYAASPG